MTMVQMMMQMLKMAMRSLITVKDDDGDVANLKQSVCMWTLCVTMDTLNHTLRHTARHIFGKL